MVHRGSLVAGSLGVGAFAALGVLVMTEACGTSSSSGNSSSGSATTSATSGATRGSSSVQTGGTSGSSSGAATGSASGSASAIADAGPGPGSSGCGSASLPAPDSIPDAGGFGGSTLPIQRFKLDVGGVSREFVLGLPARYDSQTKYPVVFAWHGAGGTDVQVAWGGMSSFDTFGGYYGLRYLSTQAGKPMIFVAGQGLDANDAGSGWPNTNGQDVAFTQAMVAWLESNFCLDEARISP